MTDGLDLDAVTIEATIERWPLREAFRISRGAKSEAVVVVVTAHAGGEIGRGEGVPYARYGETVDGVLAHCRSTAARDVGSMPPGAARSALDAALLDLEAEVTGVPVHVRLGLSPPAPCTIARTLSIGSPDEMARRAREGGALLKLKLAGDGLDLERARAVHAARPEAELWLDANEGLDLGGLDALAPELAALGVVLLEQPLPAASDAVLDGRRFAVPICADESVHDARSIPGLAGRYGAVNVKLDKTGGLREALRTIEAARAHRLGVVLGCMVSTSLSIAPAQLLAPLSDRVDLDGALFLAADREGGVELQGDRLLPGWLWGP